MRKIIVFALAAILIVALSATFVTAEATNVAAGKTYTYTGQLDTQYPDDGNELTDGTTGTAAEVGYASPIWVGVNTGGVGAVTADKQNMVILDLGSVTEGITDFAFYAQECGGGIGFPATVEILVSDDNAAFTSVGEATKEFLVDLKDAANPTYGIYKYSLNSAETSARYVKFLITHATATWVFISEVEVKTGGTAGTTSTATSAAESAVESEDDSSEPTNESSTVAADDSDEASDTSKAAVDDSSEDEDGGIDTWVIVGIAAGVVAIIAIVVIVIKKKKQTKKIAKAYIHKIQNKH